jgi:hypothetical protein
MVWAFFMFLRAADEGTCHTIKERQLIALLTAREMLPAKCEVER